MMGASVSRASLSGIFVADADGTRIGAPGVGNVVANAEIAVGIFVTQDTNTTIQGNLVGTDVGGTIPLGTGLGIFVQNSILTPTGNKIGGSEPGEGNLIAGGSLFNVA